MSTLQQVMGKELKKIAHSASVREATMRMRDERIGSLFVEKAGQLVGIVTETDVIRKAVAAGTDLGKTTVEKIMSAPIATIEANRTIHDASDMMSDLGVRHLGVTESGTIVGVVSVRDLLVAAQRVSEPKITQD